MPLQPTAPSGSVRRSFGSASTVIQRDDEVDAPQRGGVAATAPAAEQDIERLAEKVWQVVRRKLALERERRRGTP